MILPSDWSEVKFLKAQQLLLKSAPWIEGLFSHVYFDLTLGPLQKIKAARRWILGADAGTLLLQAALIAFSALSTL